MPKQPAWIIQTEILECAKHCLAAEDSKAAATKCMHQLLAKGWGRSDIDAVVRGAFSVLAHLKSLEHPPHEILPTAE
jgi:hypothetical protein